MNVSVESLFRYVSGDAVSSTPYYSVDIEVGVMYVCQQRERGRQVGRVTRGKVASASFKSFFGHASSPQDKQNDKIKKKSRQDCHPTGHGSMVARREKRRKTPIDGRVWRRPWPMAEGQPPRQLFLAASVPVLRLVSFQVETLAAFCGRALSDVAPAAANRRLCCVRCCMWWACR